MLPIARQTTHVDGTQAEGSADAQLNVEDLIKTFGASYLQSQGGRFLMFLDVEGTPRDFSMSSERKTFLVWWTALLLFIAIATYIKHNKEHTIHEPQGDVTTANPASAPPGRELAPVETRRR